MDIVEFYLSKVISNWCGQPSSSYGPNIQLKTLWSRGGNAASLYDPQGMYKLIGCLYAYKVFRDCPKALDLTLGFFQGGISTYKNLYDYLDPCGN